MEKVNGKVVRDPNAILMRAITLLIRGMGTEYFNGLVVTFIKENIRMMSVMVMER